MSLGAPRSTPTLPADSRRVPQRTLQQYTTKQRHSNIERRRQQPLLQDIATWAHPNQATKDGKRTPQQTRPIDMERHTSVSPWHHPCGLKCNDLTITLGH